MSLEDSDYFLGCISCHTPFAPLPLPPHTHTLSLHHTHPSNISLQAGEVSKQTHWLFLIVLNTCLDVYVDGRVGSGDGYCRKISGGMCG